MNNVHPPRFKIGFTFQMRNRNNSIATIIDILETYNSSGELVKVSYIATHQYGGQTVTNYDVADATVARGMCDLEKVNMVQWAIAIQMRRLNMNLTNGQKVFLHCHDNNIPCNEITLADFVELELADFNPNDMMDLPTN